MTKFCEEADKLKVIIKNMFIYGLICDFYVLIKGCFFKCSMMICNSVLFLDVFCKTLMQYETKSKRKIFETKAKGRYM